MTFDVIMADPPWRYDSPRAMVGSRGRGAIPGIERVTQVDVSAHYPTMSLDEIKAMKVAALAARDAFLFLWTTGPFLADGSAADVARAWGFRPSTVLTWAKAKPDGTPSMKTGHWFRSASEHIIFALRGAPRRPAGWDALPTWSGLPRLPRHSEKPDAFFRLAERFGTGSCLELFARGGPRGPRWSVWGNEATPAPGVAEDKK